MRIISVLLAVLIAVSLCGCRKVQTGTDGNSSALISSEKTSSKTSGNKKENNTSSKVDPAKCKHKFSAVSIAATCTTDGKLVKSCSICGFSEENIIEAKGHIMILGKCGNCDYVDTVENVKTIAEWLKTNANGKYVLSDSRYYMRTNGNDLILSFNDGAEGAVFISVYGMPDNMCHIEYVTDESIEADFPMEWVHSANRVHFEKMSGTANDDLQSDMVDELLLKIDTILKTFDNAMKEKVDISIASIGFTAFELEE